MFLSYKIIDVAYKRSIAAELGQSAITVNIVMFGDVLLIKQVYSVLLSTKWTKKSIAVRFDDSGRFRRNETGNTVFHTITNVSIYFDHANNKWRVVLRRDFFIHQNDDVDLEPTHL